ncbi:MAG: phosphate-starvation-inducible E [Betaproteobacteria bacterium]|nr:MAG: phosphate-starvation-inducible E [Betaproteobacteria bacterium]
MKQNRMSVMCLSVLSVIEHVGLIVITLATISAMATEVLTIVGAGVATLADLLLLFLYLEVIAMVGLYYKSGKLPVRFPIYIAIVAMARYLVLEMKTLETMQIIGVAGAVLLLTLAVFAIRFGHVRYPYSEDGST